MLDSERVQRQTFEARWLYATILLGGDDFGLLELNHFKLGRDAGIDQTKVGMLLQMLADADLIRPYRVEEKLYAFIPRYRQRLNATKFKHPLPPYALYADDVHAFNQINNLVEKSRGIPASPGEPPLEPELEPEPKEKKEPTVLVKRSALDASPVSGTERAGEETPDAPPYRVPDCPYTALLDSFHRRLPMLPTIVVFENARRAPLRQRWAEVCAAEKFDTVAGLEWFDDFYRIVSTSAFLTGRATTFKASWDWLHKPTNFAKAIEGNYADNRRAKA